MKNKRFFPLLALALPLLSMLSSCGEYAAKKSGPQALSGATDAASKVYVAPGSHDEFYLFTSGGFSGQVGVYGLPSGRLFRVIPVFSVDGEKAYGFSEETKPMLMTTYGFIPWDDSHHPKISQTDGIADGRWLFINGNNTPRIARIDLTTFETAEILEVPFSGGNHSSPFLTQGTEYVIAGTRFSVPIPQTDASTKDFAEKFKGTLSFIKVDPKTGEMKIHFQVLMPGFDYDLSHSGKGPSHGWTFFTTYNTEQQGTLKEIEASQNDKDYVAAINWQKAAELVDAGQADEVSVNYYHNTMDEATQSAKSEVMKTVKILDPSKHKGFVYFLPTPKSPHGVDVDPTGEYIVTSGKLSADMAVHSFSKMLKAIETNAVEKELYGIPVLKYEDVLGGIVKQPGLGPLHTEFDDNGYGYTSFFISSEIVKWKVATQEVVDRVPTYYSIGHLCVPGGDTRKPWGKYVIALNKITKDRYLPTGPELTQSAQLYDISGEKMKLLLDFPTIGEPHYAQAIPASVIVDKSKKVYRLEENKHPYAIKSEDEAKVVRDGKTVHVYMSTIRSHFAPDNIEGVRVGDVVYFHVTNLEQDWDVPHGFAVLGAENSELLLMPGMTRTLKWEPKVVGNFPMYCTDFCSALHQEMQGYVRVSPAGSSTPLKWWTGSQTEL